MKYIKKTVCCLLVLVTILSLFSGCSEGKTEDDIYLTRGEFFSYIVYENNLSSDFYTVEDIQNSEDGAVEAAILEEWGFIDEKAAQEKLTKPVDRETVVAVCARLTDHLKTGDPGAIKDADLLQDPQLIADAYASGLTELENGYFSGARKMSFTDCETVWEKSCAYTANFHFEANTEKIEIADDVVTFDPEDYEEGAIIVEFEEEEAEEEEPNDSGLRYEIPGSSANAATLAVCCPGETGAAQQGYCDYLDEDPQIVNTGTDPLSNTRTTGFSARIQKNFFKNNLKSPKVGDIVYLPRFDLNVSIGPSLTPGIEAGSMQIVGILRGISETSTHYICMFDTPEFEPAVEKISINEANKSGFADFKQELGECFGWKLDFSFSSGRIDIKAKKDFTVRETGRKQEWQNASKTVTATADFSISNFNIDVENLQSFAKKSGSGFVKITYDSNLDFSLSTSLRYTPDDNRNGKFPSNWNNSRWTDSDAKGAKEIKIARFRPSFYGIVGGEIYIYLRVTFDGKITFGLGVDDGGVKISVNNGKIRRQNLGTKKEYMETTANICVALGVEASLTIFTIIKVITYDVSLQLDLNAIANLYYEEELKSKGVYADEEGLTDYGLADSKFNYCIGVSYALSIVGELKNSGVKLILDCLSKGTSLNFKVPLISRGLHYEDGHGDGHKVDECTRGKDPLDSLPASEDGDIALSTYKIAMEQYTCSSVDLKSIPSETVNLSKCKNSVTVESLDPGIVKVHYDKKGATIYLEAVGEGSTEIVIHAQTGHWFWKKTVDQKVSVTVTPYSDYTWIIT